MYFQELSKKVFDVQINGLTAIKGLDIFARAGFATAYDVHVPFTVRGMFGGAAGGGGGEGG